MTAIIVANSIAAVVVVGGLAVVMRLGHLTAGGRFTRALHRLEMHRGSRVVYDVTERRAA